MAANAGGAAGGLMLDTGPPGHQTFTTYYNDATQDDLRGNYGPLMQSFLVNGTPPQHLRNTVFLSDPRTTATGYMFLVEVRGYPAHPGMLTTLHTVTRYNQEVGCPASTWDTQVFGIAGDVVLGSMPTMYEFPAGAFQLVNLGNQFRIPIYQRAIAQFNTDNAAQVLGPYDVHDVGTEFETFRNCALCLQPMTVRQGVELLAANIITNGEAVACAPLLRFLLMAATIRQGETRSQLRVPAITPVAADNI
jgi:hypothetical protein